MNELEQLRQPRPCARVLTIAQLTAEATAILEQHGCRLEGTRMHVPSGTLQTERLPRTSVIRYHLAFPDGYTVTELFTQERISLVYLPRPGNETA